MIELQVFYTLTRRGRFFKPSPNLGMGSFPVDLTALFAK
jgi:hypothetical protein